ncbi:PREDICTED: glucagon receptor isoform X3 [Cercocebus atys]|uniref:glucagon receptor isoform X3 n=1 Tax=Cercocebus atys TaxID=9531 RepID=UPI0005F3F11B|nr:PREDICTED: glucagon receptor isoform X3 [Cercocebus atys]
MGQDRGCQPCKGAGAVELRWPQGLVVAGVAWQAAVGGRKGVVCGGGARKGGQGTSGDPSLGTSGTPPALGTSGTPALGTSGTPPLILMTPRPEKELGHLDCEGRGWGLWWVAPPTSSVASRDSEAERSSLRGGPPHWPGLPRLCCSATQLPSEERAHPPGLHCPSRAAPARCGRQLAAQRHAPLSATSTPPTVAAAAGLPELVCNRTFDKYSCWPDTPANTTANISCPWYLPWHHKVQHRFVFKRCGPDGQWVRGPRGQPWRDASQCQMDGEELEVQKEVAKMYSSFQVMYTVGYSLSLGALLLALAILGGISKLHCTRNAIHANLFVSFVLKASSVLVIDGLLRTRYSQKIGDDLSVSIWLSDGAVAGCRVAAVFMQYGVVANYCWLLVEGLYLHNLLGLATLPERSFFSLYLGIGWGAPMLFIIPWVVVRCLFENIQCWTSNNNMDFWWILRFPVFLAILINFFIFIRIVHLLVAKLRARQMHHTDYKFRSFQVPARPRLPHPGRSMPPLTTVSLQGLLVAVLYCFLNKEVQSELRRHWHRWRLGKVLQEERGTSNHKAPSAPGQGLPGKKLQSGRGGGSQDSSAEIPLAGGLPRLAESPFSTLLGPQLGLDSGT